MSLENILSPKAKSQKPKAKSSNQQRTTNNQQRKKVYESIIECIANNHQRTTKKDIKKGNLSYTLFNVYNKFLLNCFLRV